MNARGAVAIGVGIGALALASACGGDDSGGDPPVTTHGDAATSSAPGGQEPSALAPDALQGRRFVAVGAEGFDLVTGSTVRLRFEGDQIGLSPGCNQYGGRYRVEDGTLVVDGLTGTEMACERPLMRQDTKLVDLVRASPSIALDGDELTLTWPDASIMFRDREIVEPDRPLAGPTWTLDTVIDGDTATGGFASRATLRVDRRQGLLFVDTGCNTGSADVEIRDGELVVGDLVLTRMACEPGVMEIERHMVSALSGKTVSFEIEADHLTIESGRTGLRFRAAD